MDGWMNTTFILSSKRYILSYIKHLDLIPLHVQSNISGGSNVHLLHIIIAQMTPLCTIMGIDTVEFCQVVLKRV